MYFLKKNKTISHIIQKKRLLIKRFYFFQPFGFLNSASDGFTLMEVLVAVMLLAISLTMIIQHFSMGLKNVGLSENYTSVVRCARNIMEESLLSPFVKPGFDSGLIDDNLKWERTISEIPRETNSSKTITKEMEIRIKIIWNYGVISKDFELVALRIINN